MVTTAAAPTITGAVADIVDMEEAEADFKVEDLLPLKVMAMELRIFRT